MHRAGLGLLGLLWALPTAVGAEPVSVSHVDITASLLATDSTTQVIRGHSRWTYRNVGNAALTEIHFALHANLDSEPNPHLSGVANAQGHFNDWSPARIDITDVRGALDETLEWRYAAAPPVVQTFSLERGLLIVRLVEPLGPGGAVDIGIDFSTTVPHRRGDAGHFNGDTTWRFGWFPQPRWREGGAWSDAYIFTSFTHRTLLTGPAGYRVIIGADHFTREGASTIAHSDVPVQSIPIVVSDRLQAVTEPIDGVEVTLYTHPDGALLDTSSGEAREKLEQIARILPYFRAHYGAYRLSTLQVVESPTTSLSMAANGLVLLGDLFFVHDRTWIAWGLYRPVGEVTLAHEIAHQWWGLGAGVAFDSDGWLSEGFSQMLALSYAEHRFGRHGPDMLEPNWFLDWLGANVMGVTWPTNQIDHQILPSYRDHVRFTDNLQIDEPLVMPQRDSRHLEETGYRLYQKGYLGARALVAFLGPEGTDRVLTEIYRRKVGDRVTVEDLRQIAREVGGVDISSLIDGFVLGRARADLEIVDVSFEAHDGGGTTRVTVRRNGDLIIPAVVEIREGARILRAPWDTNHAETIVQVPTSRRPDSVEIDPDRWVPDTDRRNNRWPTAVRAEWLGPQPDVGAHVIGFNPLPLNRRYLFGVTMAGRQANTWWWHVGGGFQGGYGTPNDVRFGEGSRQVYIWHGFADVGVWLSRNTSLTVWTDTTEFNVDGEGDYDITQLGLRHAWGIRENTDLGLAGTAELPRTVLLAGVSVGVTDKADAEAWDPWDDPVEDETRFVLSLGVFRNDVLSHGLSHELSLRGGVIPFREHEEEPETYGVAVADTDYRMIVPWVGRLILSARMGGVTDGAPSDERPDLRLLPATQYYDASVLYDVMGAAGARLRVPLLRDRRIKNVLTLGLLIFDDLSMDLHYGVAWGAHWSQTASNSSNGELNRGDPLGEAGIGAVVGIGSFLGVIINLTVGVGVPVWPAAPDLDDRRWFVRFDLGDLPIDESAN